MRDFLEWLVWWATAPIIFPAMILAYVLIRAMQGIQFRVLQIRHRIRWGRWPEIEPPETW